MHCGDRSEGWKLETPPGRGELEIHPASSGTGNLAVGEGAAQLFFNTEPGRWYDVLFNNNLADTNGWQLLLEDVSGNGNPVGVWDPAVGEHRFYSIRVRKE